MDKRYRTMESRGPWLAIIDPAAADGRTEREWPHIKSLLKQEGIDTEAAFSQHKYHAVELTVKAVTAGIRHIIVVGDTATLHEVVNGVFIQQTVPTTEVTLGMIPVRPLKGGEEIAGFPYTYPDAVKAIASGYFVLRDAAAVMYHKSSYGQERYIVSSAVAGMEAVVLKKLSRLKGEGQKNRFRKWLAAAKALISYRPPEAVIWIDGVPVVKGRVAGVSLSLCRSEGDEGNTLEISVSSHPGRLAALFHARSLCRGKIRLPVSATMRGESIRMESYPPMPLAADGEPLGCCPMEIRPAFKSLRIAVPRNMASTTEKPAFDHADKRRQSRGDNGVQPQI